MFGRTPPLVMAVAKYQLSGYCSCSPEPSARRRWRWRWQWWWRSRALEVCSALVLPVLAWAFVWLGGGAALGWEATPQAGDHSCQFLPENTCSNMVYAENTTQQIPVSG